MAEETKYYVGETITLFGQFKDDAGDPKTPVEPVKLTHNNAAGDNDINGEEISEGTTGYYEKDYTITESGWNHYAFVSEDNAVEEGEYYAHPREAEEEA